MISHPTRSFAILAAVGTLLVGCGTEPLDAEAVGIDSNEAGLGAAPPDVRCLTDPNPGAKGSWRHSIGSTLVSTLGSPRHRGIDLIASATSTTQTIAGEISYGL